jgi:hypothetical protein
MMYLLMLTVFLFSKVGSQYGADKSRAVGDFLRTTVPDALCNRRQCLKVFDSLDGKEVGDGRIMKVRFAPSHAAIKVPGSCVFLSDLYLVSSLPVFEVFSPLTMKFFCVIHRQV